MCDKLKETFDKKILAREMHKLCMHKFISMIRFQVCESQKEHSRENH